jgi:hypothetical protein
MDAFDLHQLRYFIAYLVISLSHLASGEYTGALDAGLCRVRRAGIPTV